MESKTNTHKQNRNRRIGIENKLVVAKGGGRRMGIKNLQKDIKALRKINRLKSKQTQRRPLRARLQLRPAGSPTLTKHCPGLHMCQQKRVLVCLGLLTHTGCFPRCSSREAKEHICIAHGHNGVKAGLGEPSGGMGDLEEENGGHLY